MLVSRDCGIGILGRDCGICGIYGNCGKLWNPPKISNLYFNRGSLFCCAYWVRRRVIFFRLKHKISPRRIFDYLPYVWGNLGAIGRLERRLWNSTNSTISRKFHNFSKIPQSILVFVECYDKVRHACLRVVAASFFLQSLKFSKVASEVATHER